MRRDTLFEDEAARMSGERRSRAAAIKERTDLARVAGWLGAAFVRSPKGAGEGGHIACPASGCAAKARVSLDLSHYLCRSCGAAGDVIAYVRQAQGTGFSAACDEIERRAATPRDTATHDLFGGA
ncbi:hypothetical protein FKB34_01915 [Glycocaulis profundi]|nr:hypothetical protein FKB34_01915 [Glycocaulis profundi]